MSTQTDSALAKARARTGRMNGAEAIIRSLEAEGVEICWGIPGGAILPLYDAFMACEHTVQHVLVRHEQGAGHMAQGYARATGRVGVCIATSGPGATNLVTPIADAFLDSTPLVAITGQVPTHLIGTDAFQEADITGIVMPIVKHSFLVQTVEDIPRAMKAAFHIALSGRPGPVLVDIPKDLQLTEFDFAWPDEVDLPGYDTDWISGVDREAIDAAADLIVRSRKPVLYVGGGVIKAEAHRELLKLAEETRIPVVTTLMARGAFPDSHELCLGMPGMHGGYAAVTAMQKADLLIALGSRFDDRVTGKLGAFAPEARIIHVDIDPAEIGKNRVADVPIVGDCRDVIARMFTEVRAVQEEKGRPDRSEWLATVKGWQRDFPYRYDQQPDGPLKPQYCIERLNAAAPDAIVVSGVGQHQMWASQFWRFEEPRTWINSGGLGTMGFAVPAALGAKAARPDRRVIAIDGDGCFQMTAQELATSKTEGIPFVTAVINNAYLGMVRQWQELFYGERYSQVYLSYDTPDYVKLAEAYGAVGLRAEHPDEVDAVIEKALSVEDRSVVIDFRVDAREMCFPMVPAGASNDEIILGPEGLRPSLDPAEAPVA